MPGVVWVRLKKHQLSLDLFFLFSFSQQQQLLITVGKLLEFDEFGVEEGGACGRGGEQAQSSALPPITPAALQQAVQAMLP